MSSSEKNILVRAKSGAAKFQGRSHDSLLEDTTSTTLTFTVIRLAHNQGTVYTVQFDVTPSEVGLLIFTPKEHFSLTL